MYCVFIIVSVSNNSKCKKDLGERFGTVQNVFSGRFWDGGEKKLHCRSGCITHLRRVVGYQENEKSYKDKCYCNVLNYRVN